MTKQKKYKIAGMDCVSCATMLELELEDMGVKAKCNYAKCELVVDIEDGKKEEKVKEIVKKLGYSLQI